MEKPMKKKQKHSREKKTNTRKSLTSAQKTKICHLKQKRVSQVKIAEQFGVAKATISEALALWISKANTALQTVTGVIIQCKATQLAEGLEVAGFNASDGWLSKFKKQYHIKEYKRLGKDASAPLEDLPRFCIDGASTHALEVGFTPTNIKLHFFPSYTIAHLQLCDAGIIWSFKPHYKKFFCEDCIEAFDFFLKSGDPPEEITIKDDFLSELFLDEELDHANEPDITNDIQDLIMQLPFNQPMDAQKYLIADNDLITTEMPTDEEIIEAVKNLDCFKPEEEDPHRLISLAEALKFISGILTFLEQQPDSSFKADSSFVRNLRKLKK
ncbi:3429_t:CDS:2, partial [Dentiscutata erythropus]